jgi:hypothetical protein
VAFSYDPAPAAGELRQGEILAHALEYRVVAVRNPGEDRDLDIAAIEHPLVMLLTADCDLLRDFEVRPPADPGLPALLPGVLVCDLHEEGRIRPQVGNAELWRRARQNQEERYHHLDAAPVGSGGEPLPDLYLDFRKAFTVPPEHLYDGIGSGRVTRMALMPPVYMQHLMHRFYSYVSRIALPD